MKQFIEMHNTCITKANVTVRHTQRDNQKEEQMVLQKSLPNCFLNGPVGKGGDNDMDAKQLTATTMEHIMEHKLDLMVSN